MAVDLICPSCHENLGKDTENEVVAFCGNCTEKFYNERGDEDNITKEDIEWLRTNGYKRVGVT